MCIFSLNIAHTMAFNTTAFWFDDLLLLINFGIYDGMPDRYIHLMDTFRKWNEPLSILKISLQHTNASSLTNKMMAGKKIGVKYSNGRRGRGGGVSEQSTIPTNNNNKWIYEDTFFTLSLKWWPSISISRGDYEWTHILLVLQRRSRKPTRTKSEEKECMFYVSDVSSPHMCTNSERKTAFRFTLDMRVWHSRRYFNKTHSHWWLLWLNILTLLLWSSQYNGL